MKNKLKKSYLDPVEEAERWKDAVDRETKGMNEQAMNRYFQKEIGLMMRRYGIKKAQ